MPMITCSKRLKRNRDDDSKMYSNFGESANQVCHFSCTSIFHFVPLRYIHYSCYFSIQSVESRNNNQGLIFCSNGYSRKYIYNFNQPIFLFKFEPKEVVPLIHKALRIKITFPSHI